MFLAFPTAYAAVKSSVLRTKTANNTVRYNDKRSVISPEKIGLIAAKLDPENLKQNHVACAFCAITPAIRCPTRNQQSILNPIPKPPSVTGHLDCFVI